MKTKKPGSSAATCNPWTLVVLFVFTAFSSGCVFLQNEFWSY